MSVLEEGFLPLMLFVSGTLTRCQSDNSLMPTLSFFENVILAELLIPISFQAVCATSNIPTPQEVPIGDGLPNPKGNRGSNAEGLSSINETHTPQPREASHDAVVVVIPHGNPVGVAQLSSLNLKVVLLIKTVTHDIINLMMSKAADDRTPIRKGRRIALLPWSDAASIQHNLLYTNWTSGCQCRSGNDQSRASFPLISASVMTHRCDPTHEVLGLLHAIALMWGAMPYIS
ncbi:hypothetical protein BD779DRAFT_265030 [Infundibulicybe gibba]|nr:hypothetical protein BD779DRAFT_265030 [Infundibulicybe gibba]